MCCTASAHVHMSCFSAVSALESSSLSTLQIHADAGTGQYGTDLDPQKLEFLRISATKNGPLAEVLDACSTQLREMPLAELDPGAAEEDDDAPEKGKKKGPDTLLSLLVGRLREIIVSGIGLPTRGACARFICGLCIARSEALKPHALQLIRALQVCQSCDYALPAMCSFQRYRCRVR
jgi:hypothetical protein